MRARVRVISRRFLLGGGGGGGGLIMMYGLYGRNAKILQRVCMPQSEDPFHIKMHLSIGSNKTNH